ncbi:uncharacterized protein PAC_13592 [Phialocephala subalpina]|uniref:CFEM domain-containing protein n=1 Tax=Phialocephala subalpina TaxID=576137 RepID=A0A1L7XF74_9HELO|nr:uncharacterized protein PAC_13592 [Phialocephala subalpina]
MKFARLVSIFSVILLATSAQANLQQYLDEVPECGLTCVTSFIPQFICNGSELCICNNKPRLAALSDCVSQNCSIIDTLQTVSLTMHQACEKPIVSRQAHLIGTVGLGIVAFALVNLRLYSRWTLGGTWNADDWIMVVVDASLPPFMVLGCLAAGKGFGLNIYDVRTNDLVTALEVFFFGEIGYVTILGLCKISVLLFYLRIFPYFKCRFACYLLLVWVVVGTVSYQFLVLFQCLPISYNWEGWKTDLGHPDRCLDLNALGYSSAGINIAQDLVILFIPIPWLIGLNTSPRKKIQILLMFGVGIFVCICSIIRLTTLPSFKATRNPTWEFTDPVYWTAIEVYVSIIIPSLPAIRSLLSHHFPRFFANDTPMPSLAVGYPPTNHSYTRSQSIPKSTKLNLDLKFSLKSTFASRSQWPRKSQRSMQGDQGEEGGREWLELGDKRKGTVHTGVVAGGAIDENDGREVYEGARGGIFVSTKTVLQETEQGNWLDDVEHGERVSWKVSDEGR